MIRRLVFFALLGLLVFSACASIQIGQAPVTTPAPPPTQLATQATPARGQGSQSRLAVTRIPVSWSDLQLAGRLVYLAGREKVDTFAMSVQVLDLATGQETTLFETQGNAYLYALSVSPDDKQLLLSYAPAQADGSLAAPTLYVMPLDGSSPPRQLFSPPTPDDEYFQPVWAPDGQSVYSAHLSHAQLSKGGQPTQGTDIYRIGLDGKATTIALSAFWPNFSQDGKQLIYVAINPQDGTNKIMLANLDGSNAHAIAMTGKWVPNIIDAPLFLPGNGTVLFSALSLTQTSYAPTWLDKLLGVTVASAHSVLSDWWSVPAGGGQATQLTHLRALGLYGSLSPDKKYIASVSGFGLFVMRPDGSGTRVLDNAPDQVLSSVNWIP